MATLTSRELEGLRELARRNTGTGLHCGIEPAVLLELVRGYSDRTPLELFSHAEDAAAAGAFVGGFAGSVAAAVPALRKFLSGSSQTHGTTPNDEAARRSGVPAQAGATPQRAAAPPGERPRKKRKR